MTDTDKKTPPTVHMTLQYDVEKLVEINYSTNNSVEKFSEEFFDMFKIIEKQEDPRVKKFNFDPMVYLFGHREDVDNALMNWLGDEFDDDVALAVLQVECDSVVRGDVAYEYMCFETIAPECISLDSIE